jgi:hypothetical protein
MRHLKPAGVARDCCEGIGYEIIYTNYGVGLGHLFIYVYSAKGGQGSCVPPAVGRMCRTPFSYSLSV